MAGAGARAVVAGADRCRRRGTGGGARAARLRRHDCRAAAGRQGHRDAIRRRVSSAPGRRPRAHSSICWPTRAPAQPAARRHRGHRLRRGSRRGPRLERAPTSDIPPDRIVGPQDLFVTALGRSACGSSSIRARSSGWKAEGRTARLGPWPSSTCCRGRPPARRLRRSRIAADINRASVASACGSRAPGTTRRRRVPPAHPGGEPLVEAVVAPADLQKDARGSGAEP